MKCLAICNSTNTITNQAAGPTSLHGLARGTKISRSVQKKVFLDDGRQLTSDPQWQPFPLNQHYAFVPYLGMAGS